MASAITAEHTQKRESSHGRKEVARDPKVARLVPYTITPFKEVSTPTRPDPQR